MMNGGFRGLFAHGDAEWTAARDRDGARNAAGREQRGQADLRYGLRGGKNR
jgi:hypothetical protein